MHRYTQQTNPGDRPILLVCHAAPALGIGHLTRTLVLAHALRKEGMGNLRLLIIGEPVNRPELGYLPHCFEPLDADFSEAVLTQVQDFEPEAIVFDIHPSMMFEGIDHLFEVLEGHGAKVVGVDSLLPYSNSLDLPWVPSFFIPPDKLAGANPKTRHGWDCFLIRKRMPSAHWAPGNRVLALTGGSDSTNQGETLPALLDASLPAGTELHWVRGPYAKQPRLPASPRLTWVLHQAPDTLDELIVSSNYAITIFGVSCFELLQYGVPTVVYSPYGDKDNCVLSALRKEEVAEVAPDAATAVAGLGRVMQEHELAGKYSRISRERMSSDGGQNLAREIMHLLGL